MAQGLQHPVNNASAKGDTMNRKDIEQWTREAGGFDATPEFLAKFAKLVAQHEREACADIAENWNSNGMPRTGVANEIRARGNDATPR
jgi:hypothetical protein